MKKETRDLIKRADIKRNFPLNTCPASRHAQMIGEALARKRNYPMLTEEPDHCGGSILSTVGSLYDARTALDAAYLMVAKNAKHLPQNAIVRKAVAYAKARPKLSA